MIILLSIIWLAIGFEFFRRLVFYVNDGRVYLEDLIFMPLGILMGPLTLLTYIQTIEPGWSKKPIFVTKARKLEEDIKEATFLKAQEYYSSKPEYCTRLWYHYGPCNGKPRYVNGVACWGTVEPQSKEESKPIRYEDDPSYCTKLWGHSGPCNGKPREIVGRYCWGG